MSLFFYYTVLSLLCYVGILVYSSSSVAMDSITAYSNGIRFVIPLLPPMLIAGLVGVRIFWIQWRAQPSVSLLVPVSLMGSLCVGFFNLSEGVGFIVENLNTVAR